MSSRNQAPRKKRTNAEVKVARAQRENRRHKKDQNEIMELRKDRQELQSSLGGVIRNIREVNECIQSKEYADKLGQERLDKCVGTIKEFVTELEDKKDFIKTTVSKLESLEEQVITKKAAVTDVIFPYNLAATPLMDTIINLTHKGIDAMASCNQMLTEVSDELEPDSNTKSSEDKKVDENE